MFALAVFLSVVLMTMLAAILLAIWRCGLNESEGRFENVFMKLFDRQSITSETNGDHIRGILQTTVGSNGAMRAAFGITEHNMPLDGGITAI